MEDNDKVPSDISLLSDLNEDSSMNFNPIEFDSSIHDLLNLKNGGEDTSNPFLESVVAPRLQDSLSLDSRADLMKDAMVLPEDSSVREIQELGLSPRLKVPGSPRAFLHSKPLGSPRFGSTTGPVLIDTTAPFESVKAAVSMFGGITDWKAHKIKTIERKKTVDQELEKIQMNMPEYKKQAFVAEETKNQVMMELESTKNIIEELKLELEKAEKEEQQAKQDSDLAKLRVEEMEQGIANGASVAAKAQLEVAKARHSSAVSELGIVREEIEMVTKEYESLLREKDLSAGSVLEAKDVERKMESLSIELIATKELLESAHVAHLEAEEKKLEAVMARDHDVYNREKELKMLEDEIERLRQETQAADDVKTKLETASTLQQELRAEIAAYKGKKDNNDIQVAVDSARKELEEVKSNIEKSVSEMKTLKIVVGSLQSELEVEKKDLSETKQREALKVRVERCTETSKKLQEAEREAKEAKSLALAAQEEMRKAKEESDQAKGGVAAIGNQLIEAKKEMEAARASEKLALAAIKALQETECASRIEDKSSSPRSILISVEEYYELSKQAHEVEEAANRKLAEIVSQIELAKEEESRVLEKLEEVSRETALRKEELREAMVKVEKAREGKVGMDHELRKWSSENGKKIPEEEDKMLGKSKSALHEPNSFEFDEQGSNVTPETKKKKKRFSLIPKVFMFLSRKKSNK